MLYTPDDLQNLFYIMGIIQHLVGNLFNFSFHCYCNSRDVYTVVCTLFDQRFCLVSRTLYGVLPPYNTKSVSRLCKIKFPEIFHSYSTPYSCLVKNVAFLSWSEKSLLYFPLCNGKLIKLLEEACDSRTKLVGD